MQSFGETTNERGNDARPTHQANQGPQDAIEALEKEDGYEANYDDKYRYDHEKYFFGLIVVVRVYRGLYRAPVTIFAIERKQRTSKFTWVVWIDHNAPARGTRVCFYHGELTPESLEILRSFRTLVQSKNLGGLDV